MKQTLTLQLVDAEDGETAMTPAEERLAQLEDAAANNYGTCSECHANGLLVWGTHYCHTCSEASGSTAGDEFLAMLEAERGKLDAKDFVVSVPTFYRWRRTWIWGLA